MMYDVLVVGGGPSGLMAAATAAQSGKRTALLEKNKLLAKKLRITGKGRCNITNSCDVEGMMHQIAVNPSFLYSALYTFTNDDLIALLNGQGLATKEERGGRIFPESDSAHDVAETLIKYAKKCGVTFLKGEVKQIREGFSVETAEETYQAGKVIVATGGLSYPLTGSTGDGYRFAEKLGHRIIQPKPSLVPLVSSEPWITELQGLSLRNISIRVYNGKKMIYDDFGEMLFTHFGVSGPVILSASSHIKSYDDCRILLDLKPALTTEQLDKRLQRDFAENTNKAFKNSLDQLLPQKLIPVIVSLSGIDPFQKVHQITREERQQLVFLLKELPITIVGTRPVEEAIITSGGVCVKEINPSTMESKLVPGLYFCGEIIDVDAHTGGFNLQIAFSTGYLAGISAGEEA